MDAQPTKAAGAPGQKCHRDEDEKAADEDDLADRIARRHPFHDAVVQGQEGGAGNQEIERELNIDESVLRYLIVRKDD